MYVCLYIDLFYIYICILSDFYLASIIEFFMYEYTNVCVYFTYACV